MKVVVGSIAAVLVTVGLVLGIEAAVSGPGGADVSTVAGRSSQGDRSDVSVLPRSGWAGSCSVSFRRYSGRRGIGGFVGGRRDANDRVVWLLPRMTLEEAVRHIAKVDEEVPTRST